MPFKTKKLNAIRTDSLDQLGVSVVDLAKFVEDEFGQVAMSFLDSDPDKIWNSVPPKPRRGTYFYADGTHWNPGSGEGAYTYDGTTYHFLGNIGTITDAPSDGNVYGRLNGAWTIIPPFPAAAPLINSLPADVNLNNIANYFIGPQVAQGTVGTWFVSGTVSLLDSAGAANFRARLTDGTTIIASGTTTSNGANTRTTISLSGFITAPTNNLRITVKDITSASGLITFNGSGDSKDSTITAYRIG